MLKRLQAGAAGIGACMGRERMNETFLCGSCREAGHCRLGLGVIMLEEGGSSAEARCASKFHAGPRVGHGGWTAAMFDDVMGRTLAKMDLATVTATLTVNFLKPVPIDEPMIVSVSIGAHEGRRWQVSARLRLSGSDVDLATAEGVWVERRPDHFQKHEAALQAHREGHEPV